MSTAKEKEGKRTEKLSNAESTAKGKKKMSITRSKAKGKRKLLQKEEKRGIWSRISGGKTLVFFFYKGGRRTRVQDRFFRNSGEKDAEKKTCAGMKRELIVVVRS